MAEVEANPRACPYLRGRYQGDPELRPSANNHCILAASIHLPDAQQSRYCLGGQHPHCHRFERQQARPLPRYVTGIPSLSPPPPPRPLALSILWWRRPWGRIAIRLALALLLAGLLVLGWRWREATIPSATQRLTPRPPLPTPLALATPAPVDSVNPYFPPTFGPSAR